MTYASSYEVQAPDRVANWRPLLHWLMAIPHVIVLYVLNAVGGVVAVISWFMVVFTGKLSSGLADVQCLVLRYNMRVTAFVAFLHEEYPPFDFTASPDEPGGTPVSVGFTPVLDARDRLTVGLRFIWAIPAWIFAAIVLFAAQIVVLIGFFAVLFTGAWPVGMRDFVVKAFRLQLKVNTYTMLLTDEYPPFALD